MTPNQIRERMKNGETALALSVEKWLYMDVEEDCALCIAFRDRENDWACNLCPLYDNSVGGCGDEYHYWDEADDYMEGDPNGFEAYVNLTTLLLLLLEQEQNPQLKFRSDEEIKELG